MSFLDPRIDVKNPIITGTIIFGKDITENNQLNCTSLIESQSFSYNSKYVGKLIEMNPPS
jgi:hypothetical protein